MDILIRQQQRETAHIETRQARELPESGDGEQREDPATNRREATAGIAAMLAAVWLPGRRPPRRVDRQLVAAHSEVADCLAGLYRSADPGAVLPMAAAYADSLLDLLDLDAAPSPLGRDLVAIAVGVHAQVGLWACHADQSPVAYRYLALAREIAAGAENTGLHCRAMGALSYLCSSAPRGGHGGRPRRALRLLDAAVEISANADAFTRGWLATWRADQHANLGDLRRAREDVELAAGALDCAGDSQLVGFFSQRTYGYGMRGHLDSVRGLVHALAGEADDAEDAFGLVHAQAANARRRVATYAHQGLAHAVNAEPEAACAALTRSTSLARRDPYPMGLRRVRGVRARFNPAWSDLASVRDLDEQLAAAGRAASAQ